MIRTDEVALLESGTSLVVGTVDDDGMPDAARAWSAKVDGDHLRLLLPATATPTVDNLRAGGAVAVTATMVDTLRSLQLKGRALAVEPATDDDRARMATYVDAFFENVHRTDGSAVERLRNLLPDNVVAVVCTVEHVFDQTPGPRAGSRLAPT